MSEATTWRGFFGDDEHAFSLPPDRVAELERKVGIGIGAISRRMFAGDFTFVEITETIRIGLVGAGMAPEAAAELVILYAHDRPLAETHPIATAILEALWWGPKAEATDAEA